MAKPVMPSAQARRRARSIRMGTEVGDGEKVEAKKGASMLRTANIPLVRCEHCQALMAGPCTAAQRSFFISYCSLRLL